MIDVLIVVYHPPADEYLALVNALEREHARGVDLAVRIRHNDGLPPADGPLAAAYARLQSIGIECTVTGDGTNPGFGVAINELAAASRAEFLFVLNQDAIPEPASLVTLSKVAHDDAACVAAWEMRQIPFEHPKNYDPVSLDCEWVSGAAVLFRKSAFDRAGGFEPRIFMYGEDVDLSWRLRVAGYRLRYIPRAAVVHRTYQYADQVKPVQALEGIYANLCLRARFSGRRQVAQGLAMAFGELMVPQSFKGRRRGILRAVWKFARNYGYFWNTRKAAPHFEPRYVGWGYEIRRDGAFHEFQSASERPSPSPLVSVLVRTHNRGEFLREALTTVANQTHRPIEVIVVEDGTEFGETVCRELASEMTIRYFRNSPAQGRSIAGNRALAEASGEWLCFLDDDDQFFADHVEVLLQAVTEHGLKGAFALAWRTPTVTESVEPLRYKEVNYERIPDEPFSRVTMWHHNLMSIQSVLFHRSLYERNGGFEVDMDQLEDWNLWTRYTIQDDFVQVRKLTSKYRVPAEVTINADRQRELDAAYRDAVARQASMKFDASPASIRALAEEYSKANALLHIGKDQVRSKIHRSRLLGKVFAWRALVVRRLHQAKR